jgi:CHAD domain-containing protein
MTRQQKVKSRTSRVRGAAVGAARALKQRLHNVLEAIEPAAKHWKKSPEPVHHLRVRARRAVAAIDLFEPLLPRRKARRLRRMMQQVRRACDQARNCDVLVARLMRHGQHRDNAPIVRRLKHERKQRQQPIIELRHNLLRTGSLDRRARKLLARVRWGRRDVCGPEPGYVIFIRARLQLVAEQFDRAMRGKHRSSKSLHRLRIRGKRLRYALELAGSAVPGCERTLKMLHEMQDRLGEINDCAMARDDLHRRLAASRKSSTSAQLKKLLAVEETAQRTASKEFAQWRRENLAGSASIVNTLTGVRPRPK